MADLQALDASIALIRASVARKEASIAREKEQLGAVPVEERLVVQQQLLVVQQRLLMDQQELVQVQQQKTALVQQLAAEAAAAAGPQPQAPDVYSSSKQFLLGGNDVVHLLAATLSAWFASLRNGVAGPATTTASWVGFWIATFIQAGLIGLAIYLTWSTYGWKGGVVTLVVSILLSVIDESLDYVIYHQRGPVIGGGIWLLLVCVGCCFFAVVKVGVSYLLCLILLLCLLLGAGLCGLCHVLYMTCTWQLGLQRAATCGGRGNLWFMDTVRKVFAFVRNVVWVCPP